MKLYLVRHGEAESIAENIQRPLNQQGLKETQIISNLLARQGVHIDQIYHSEKLRASQTAKELAKNLNPQPKITTLAGLLPDDSVKPMTVYCNQWQEDTMLVGHLPYMAKLVSEILFHTEEKQCIDFYTASILCLERIIPFHWYISWFVHPFLLEE